MQVLTFNCGCRVPAVFFARGWDSTNPCVWELEASDDPHHPLFAKEAKNGAPGLFLGEVREAKKGRSTGEVEQPGQRILSLKKI